MHRAVGELHLALGAIGPAQGMLHPGLVIALGKILARMRPAAFLARQGALAFELWLGVAPPLDVMTKALL